MGTEDRGQLAPEIVRHPRRVLERQVEPRDPAVAGQDDPLLARDVAGEMCPKLADAGDALRRAREFISEASGPPKSKEEEERLISTLHALDDASRLAELAGETGEFAMVAGRSDDVRAVEWCAEVMRYAGLIADQVGALPGTADEAAKALARKTEVATNGASIEQALIQLERSAKTLRELQLTHRKATLSSVTGGALSADEAIARVDTVRRLEALAHHAWRCAAHLVGG